MWCFETLLNLCIIFNSLGLLSTYEIIQSVNSDCSTSFFTISYTLSLFLSWLPCLGFSVLCWIQVVKVGILAYVNLSKRLAFSLLHMLAATLQKWSLLCWRLFTLYIGLEFLSWRAIAFYKIPFLHLLLYSVLINLLNVLVFVCLSVGVYACMSTEMWKPENSLDCCSSGVLPPTICLFVFALVQGFSLCQNLLNALD